MVRHMHIIHSRIFTGDVANDVETEQIVWDMNCSPCFHRGKFTAYVQRRGSVSVRVCVYETFPVNRYPCAGHKTQPIDRWANRHQYRLILMIHMHSLRDSICGTILYYIIIIQQTYSANCNTNTTVR
jgi:hypothetical protein